MTPLRTFLAAALFVACCECAIGTDAPLQPMKTCVVGVVPRGVAAATFSRALLDAQRYSVRIYGADCLVCAEVMADSDSGFTLHITSPIEDMLLNTSATISFRKPDLAVLKTAQYHSCRARIKEWGK
jgi:hypothetical protein